MYYDNKRDRFTERTSIEHYQEDPQADQARFAVERNDRAAAEALAMILDRIPNADSITADPLTRKCTN